jgi:hypothetical protein
MSDKNAPVLTIELSRKGHHLVFNLTTYDEYGFGEQKRALMPVDTKNFDPEDILAKAQELAEAGKWEFSKDADQSGWFRVLKVA